MERGYYVETRRKVNSVQDREPTHFRFYRTLYKFSGFSSLLLYEPVEDKDKSTGD